MKPYKKHNVFFVVLILLFFAGIVKAQTAGITSGAIYTLASKTGGRLLNVGNSSMADGANVDTWTDTESDAERWIVTHIDNNLYTFTNVGSGKLLHTAEETPVNSVNVDQHGDTGDNTVLWAVVDAGEGYFTLKTAADQNFCLDLGNGTDADGANVQVWQSNTEDPQKWLFTERAPQEAAPTAETADEIFEAWSIGYDIVNDNGFWGTAEMMEIVLDAYEVTGEAKYRAMFDQMYDNFIQNHGEDWMNNNYNDDIAWISIACVRSYLMTGNTTHLNKAKDQFDKMYARANTGSYGGGLLWYDGLTTKNACINGPAMVACCYMAQATGDSSYYDKALYLYEWSKTYLLNENTGKVNDSYDGTTNTWSSTYNQGTYLGASVMLYNYTNDPYYLTVADRIAQYTKVNMYNSGVMNNEEGGNDLPGFKGIFMRYARRYVVDCNKEDYIPWLQLNAKVAYNNRNTEKIITTQWATRTSETNTCTNFSASTAVSLMMNCPKATNLTRDPYSVIESEDFDYLKGVIVEQTADVSGEKQIGGIQDGYYTAYMNVDFGSEGAMSAEFRFSSATEGGTIEIRLDGLDGTLIGTAAIPGTGAWDTYETVSTNIAKTTGMQDIYLVYTGSGYLFNINNFKFYHEDITNIQGAVVPPKATIAITFNPETNQLYINPGKSSAGEISITDMLGRMMYMDGRAVSGPSTLDVSKYPRGVYLVTAGTGSRKINMRFVTR